MGQMWRYVRQCAELTCFRGYKCLGDKQVNSTVSIDRTSPMSFQESLSDHNEPHRHTGEAH